MERPVDIESVQLPTYFFLAESYAATPWPSNVCPGIISPLKSVMRHRPPQPRTLVSTPVDFIGGAPGAMVISTTASHVPASFLNSSCSGPGFGTGGICCAPADA